MPVGTYWVNCKIKRSPKFKPYGNEPYPRFKKGFLNDIKVHSHKNPHKASISLEKRFIVADPKFYNHEYKPVKTFTLCHEVFHFFFHCKTIEEKKNRFIAQYYEKKCDEAAKNFMLANGWNPSQVSLAIQLLLRGQHRKDCIRRATTDPKNNFRR